MLDGHLQRAVATNRGYTDFLQGLIRDSLVQKAENGNHRRVHLAHFPFVKGLEEFDFTFQPSVPKSVVEELATLRFIDRNENCVLLGPPGVDKTHLVVALGVRACQAGHKVLFTTIADLAASLHVSRADHTFTARLRAVTQPALLIMDDVGFLPLDKQAANDFFRVVASRYERGAITLTSNKSFADWGQVLGDGAIASAILDRLLHHTAAVLNIRGESYRLRERKTVLSQEVQGL